MNYIPISIISEIDGDRQMWTFCIEEADLVSIMDKYGHEGESVRGDTNDIIAEVSAVWQSESQFCVMEED